LKVTLIPYQCQHGTTPQELADTLTFIKTSIPAEEEGCENTEKVIFKILLKKYFLGTWPFFLPFLVAL